MKTYRSKSQTRKTQKRKINSEIVQEFIQVLNTVKLYHWKTHSFSQHKATDELYKALNEHIDKFVEILMGKQNVRIYMPPAKISLVDIEKTSEIRAVMEKFREMLTKMNKRFSAETDTDLLNVRDEILGDVNQFMYLLSLT